MVQQNFVRPALELLEKRLAPAITIQFDYSYDRSGFFARNPAAKAVLQQAGQIFGSRFRDELTAIHPENGRTWTAYFSDPNTLKWTQRANLDIPANTLRIFVGGGRFRADYIGEGSPGFGAGDALSDADRLVWQNVVALRGQAANDFGPWGGSMSFNVATNWSFAGLGGGAPAGNQQDFLSVAVHELGHVLGIGTATSWQSNVRPASRLFVGSHARAANGGPVPLARGLTHWAAGVRSKAQVPMMSEVLTAGTRKLATPLDWAALVDIGWSVARVARLGFVTQPPATTEVRKVMPVVRVQLLDQYGQPFKQANQRITITLVVGKARTFYQAYTNTNGVAVFRAIVPPGRGAGKLIARSAGLLAAASDPFQIV